MESKKISENITDLAGNVKEYLLLQLDLVRLIIAEKASKLLTTLIVVIAMFIIFLFLLTFLSLAFVFWYKDHVGEAYVGALIMAGFYFLLAVVLYLMRTAIFVNPLVLAITKILLEKKDESK